MRRHDDGCFCVDGGETVEEDVGAVDFVRQRVRSVSGRPGRSDRRSYRHDVAPVGIREPARCLASTEDVLCHQELPTVTLRERDEICFAGGDVGQLFDLSAAEGYHHLSRALRPCQRT